MNAGEAIAAKTAKTREHGTNVAAWIKTHKGIAAGAAGVVGVVAFALHQRSSAGTSKSAVVPAAAGLNAVPPGRGAFLREIRQQQREIRHLQHPPHRPPHPHHPHPLPKPGVSRYTIHAGDSLRSIALRVYGTDTARALHRLRVANPLLASFGDRARLTYYAGDRIRIPVFHRGGHHQPNPRPPRRRHRQHQSA